jgi:hypothetical protein
MTATYPSSNQHAKDFENQVNPFDLLGLSQDRHVYSGQVSTTCFSIT